MTVAAAPLLTALPTAAFATDDHIAGQPRALEWSPSPPGLPPGARIAVISGSPGSDDPHVVRTKLLSGKNSPPQASDR